MNKKDKPVICAICGGKKYGSKYEVMSK